MSDSTQGLVKEESEETSDDNLVIVIESPSRKRKAPPIPTESERQIIDSIEDELERKLEEKAAKTNLNAIHVRKIIKHLVTNEHVLTLIRNAENAQNGEESSLIFEPKWTRSKTKELSSTSGVVVPPVPWASPKPSSEVQALFTENLQEDSSGDEYVPNMGDDDLEESEDDPDSSFLSDPPSVEPSISPEPEPIAPSTPPPCTSCSTEITTNWSEDGIFKIPSTPKDKEECLDEATIAKRTRSKLCLSSTPLEVIEEAFIPPDITTDMYEMDCDNEDWMNFLKTFTRPLEEVVKVPEEEELDPEYNVLLDEGIDKPDKEELRVDKAVKVSKKELNALFGELYDFCTTEQAYLDSIEEDEIDATSFFETPVEEECKIEISETSIGFNETVLTKNEPTLTSNSICNVIKSTLTSNFICNVITDLQISLLEQQMRQHVQLLTQNFILTYGHSELHNYSTDMKEYLLNLKHLAGNKEKSVFLAINLDQALNMLKYWEDLVKSNTDDVKKMKQHVEQTITESLRYKQRGSEYIVKFPTLILETISKSEIFLYPTLLPKIPFKSPRFFPSKVMSFTDSELQIIALGLEQFTPFALENIGAKHSKKYINQVVSSYISHYMLPIKPPNAIYNKICQCAYKRCANNPIKYFYIYNKAPAFVQYLISLEDLQVLPPCGRRPEELPYQWSSYIYPQTEKIQFCPVILNSHSEIKFSTVSKPVLNIQKPICPNSPATSYHHCPSQRKKRLKRPSRRLQIIKTKLIYSNLDPITKFIECLGKPSPINNVLELFTIEDFTCTNSSYFKYAVDDINEGLPNKDQNVSHKNVENVSSEVDPLDVETTMLPNMPSLFTPIKIESSGDRLNCTVEGKNVDSARKDIAFEISEEGVSDLPCPYSSKDDTAKCSNQEIKIDITKHNKDEINVPLTPTSTVKPLGRKEPSAGEKKRAKLKKEFLTNLAISTPEDPAVEKKKNEMFALAFYDKMRETLEIESYHKIMQILNDYEEGDAIDLYRKIEVILRPKYKELADEFLLFLREREAAAVGRLIPWIRMNNRSKFLRKLEIYFKDQPSQLRKIYQCLSELSQTSGVSMEKIKSTLVPMLKGNSVLTDLFLQNFLNEPPPPSLLEGPFEFVDVNKELSAKNEEESFETITVPDVEDKYGGNTCICNCHEIEDVEFKTRFRHCSRCGVKFLNGSVYLQTGRGLRPALVSFLTSSSKDHQLRLTDRTAPKFAQRRKRGDASPSKRNSVSKDNPDEESDEERDKNKKRKRKPRVKSQKTTYDTNAKDQQKKRTPSKSRNLNKEFKSTPRKRACKKADNASKVEQVEVERIKTEMEEHTETEHDDHIETEHVDEHVETELEEQTGMELKSEIYIKLGSCDGQQEMRLLEESCEEGDQSAAGESSGEVKIGSPEQQTAESESEFCEESSQDNCESDSNSSISSLHNRSKDYANVLGQNSSWNRDEDKIILEVFQTENDKDHAFRAIAHQLRNRTVNEIKSRFDTLMELLMKTVDDHRD